MEYRPQKSNIPGLRVDEGKAKNAPTAMNGGNLFNNLVLSQPNPSQNVSDSTYSSRRASTNPNDARRRSSSNAENKKFGMIDPSKDTVGHKLKDVELAGFNILARTKSYHGRTFWSIVIAAAISFLIYEIVRTVQDFLDSPVITTYTLHPQEKMEFPSVVVCPAVFINASFYEKNKVKSRDALRILNTYANIYKKNTTENSTVAAKSFRIMNSDDAPSDNDPSSNLLDGNAAHDFLLDMGFDENLFFLKCQFYSETGLESLPCDDIATPILDKKYGKCFELSVGDRQQTREDRGLSLTIDTFSKRYVKDKRLIENYVGLFILVDQSYQPAATDRVLVPPGTYTKLAVSKERFEMLNLKSGPMIQPCKDADAAKLTILNATYSETSCQFECLLKTVIDKCHCVPLINKGSVISSVLAQTPFCGIKEIEGCIKKEVTDSEETDKIIDDCTNTCYPPCESWRYRVSTSSAALNPIAFRGQLEHNATVDELVLLEIAFSRIEYVDFTQSDGMTFDTFVGNAGGQITLWIGGCLLTLLPLPIACVGFIFVNIMIKFDKWRNKDA